jgi:hypothetical protein
MNQTSMDDMSTRDNNNVSTGITHAANIKLLRTRYYVSLYLLCFFTGCVELSLRRGRGHRVIVQTVARTYIQYQRRVEVSEPGSFCLRCLSRAANTT